MLNWLRDNAGTILVLLVLVAVLAAVIRYLIREKRSGKGVCGKNCQNCAMHQKCSGGQRPQAFSSGDGKRSSPNIRSTRR